LSADRDHWSLAFAMSWTDYRSRPSNHQPFNIMNHLKGFNFDAVGIEHSFAIFMQEKIGERGHAHDAEVFRAGEVRQLGQVIERLANHLQLRVDRVLLGDAAKEKPGARLSGAIEGLRTIARDMKNSESKEPEDYHWLVVGELVLAIAAILDHNGV
jgi:hypothetical protein